MQARKRREFKELLVLVHPNWLEYASVFGLDNAGFRQHVRAIYSKGRIKETDFKRYRKAMFDVYGRAIIEAAKRPDVFVAILAVPMKLAEYKEFLGKNRTKAKTAEHTDVLRFITFAKEQLGRRLVVINSPGLRDLEYDTERLANILRRKRVKFRKDFVIRGGGEISAGCVQTAVNKLKFLLRPKRAYVDRRICGDIISNFPKRRIARHMQRPKPAKRKQKALVRRPK